MDGKGKNFKNFAEYWAEGDWSEFITQLHPNENKHHTLAVLEQPAGSYPDPGFDEFQIQLITHGFDRGRVTFGDQKFDMRGTPGSIVLAPPNVDQGYELSDAHRVVALAVDKQTMRRFEEQCDIQLPKDFGALHSKAFFDPIVETLMLRMLEHAMMEHPVSDLFLDDAANTILTTLFHRSDATGKTASPSGPLSDGEVRRVSELVDDRLEGSLSIADLASVTSLSDHHFARAFKSATDLSPYQFVLRRRVARAKDMLANSDLPLAQIALAAGFSSQSHMSDVFQKKVGTTPGRYRKEFS